MFDTSHYNTGGNSPDDFLTLSPDEQKKLLELIALYLRPRKTLNTRHSSYGLKHQFERLMPGGYLTNGQMKGAMLAAGYEAGDQQFINWTFNVSEQSPLYEARKRSIGITCC